MPTEDTTAAATIREWLVEVLAEKGWSPAQWAQAAGVAATTVQRAVKPTYAFTTSSRTLSKLAAVAGRAAPDLTAATAPVEARFLPVRYRVQAGHWFEVDESAQDFGEPPYPVAPDPRFAGFPQWLERVEGDSMDRRIAPGAFAHVVDAIEMGYAPRSGDLVIVERRRDGGGLRERSIKEVLVNRSKVELWPRSTNPRWSEPLIVNGGARDGEHIEVEVVGVVIGAYLPFR